MGASPLNFRQLYRFYTKSEAKKSANDSTVSTASKNYLDMVVGLENHFSHPCVLAWSKIQEKGSPWLKLSVSVRWSKWKKQFSFHAHKHKAVYTHWNRKFWDVSTLFLEKCLGSICSHFGMNAQAVSSTGCFDGPTLWLSKIPGCGRTQRQFSTAHNEKIFFFAFWLLQFCGHQKKMVFRSCLGSIS